MFWCLEWLYQRYFNNKNLKNPEAPNKLDRIETLLHKHPRDCHLLDGYTKVAAFDFLYGFQHKISLFFMKLWMSIEK